MHTARCLLVAVLPASAHNVLKQHCTLSAALLSLLGELLAFHGVLLWKGMSTYDYILARREQAQREAVATGSFHERAAAPASCCRKLRILPDVTGGAGGGNGQATGGAGANVSSCRAGLGLLHGTAARDDGGTGCKVVRSFGVAYGTCAIRPLRVH